MSIAVTITRDDQGGFSISVDQDATPDQDSAAPPSTDATQGSAPGAEPSAAAQGGDTDSSQDSANPPTPVKDLNQALQLTAKILSQPVAGGQSPFDQGVASTLPQKG